MRKAFKIEETEIMENRLSRLGIIIEKCKQERLEEQKRKEMFWKEKRTALEREKEGRRLRLESKRRKEEKWGMVRWLSGFINLNFENGGEEGGKRKVLEETVGENPMEICCQWVWERNGVKQKKWADHKICEFWGKEAEYRLEQLRQITHPGNAILADVENRGRGKYIKIKYGWSAGRKLRKFKKNIIVLGK